jgi:tRNA U34 5-carboxymethylaminomethyl modifying enzyme MnmG/GidA
MKSVSDITVLISVFVQDVPMHMIITISGLNDAYFEDFAYIIHHGRIKKQQSKQGWHPKEVPPGS